MVAAATSALASNGAVHYGMTKVSIPSVLLTVRVDNAGNVTGSGSQVKVSHSEPGTWCHKVNKVTVVVYADPCPWSPGPGGWCNYGPDNKYFSLCNFNESDATFNFVFPAAEQPYQVSQVKQAWIRECQASGKNGVQLTTEHPLYKRDLSMQKNALSVKLYYTGNDFENFKYPVPPVILTCDPCPQLVTKDNMQLRPDQMVTLNMDSMVSGGIKPYTISFEKIPTGLIQQGNVLTGRPARGSYIGKFTVSDSCRSATNKVTGKFQFDVKEDFTRPSLSALSITPSTLPATGGDVVFKVTASDNKAVTAVNAAVSGPGFAMTVPLARISGTEKLGVWQGTYKAAPNTTSQDISYTVNCNAWDSDGNKSYSYKGGPVFIVKRKPAGSTMPSKPKGSTIQ